MEGNIGEIRMFAGNFNPKYWAYCQGQLLTIADNTALFSILSNTYGGDGTTNFSLPDFRGRVAVGVGQGTGLSNNITLGQAGGAEDHALSTSEMPAHTHTVTVTAGTGTSSATATLNAFNTPSTKMDPTGNYIGASRTATAAAFVDGTVGTIAAMNAGSITIDNISAALPNVAINNAGSGTAFSLMQPFLGMNYIICVNGVFPTRN